MVRPSPEKPTREALEPRLREFFERDRGGLAAVWLYGSLARDRARPGSDVDVGVLYRNAPPRTLDGPPFDLEGDLERLLGLPVQVVVLNRAPADLVHRVLRDGVLLAEADRGARIRFEVRKRNEFFDLEPIRRRYRRTETPA
jgi:predicted nucleotidyltransferase